LVKRLTLQALIGIYAGIAGCSRPAKENEDRLATVPQPSTQKPEKLAPEAPEQTASALGTAATPSTSFQRELEAEPTPEPIPDFSSRDMEAGKRLAETYCKTCHRLPSPASLDKRTFHDYVLPAMATRLGRYPVGNKTLDRIPEGWFEPGIGGERVRHNKVFPSEARLTEPEWQKIVAYYVGQAPDRPTPRASEPAIGATSPRFTARALRPAQAPKEAIATATLLSIHPKTGHLYLGSAEGSSLDRFRILPTEKGFELGAESHSVFNSPPVALTFFKGGSLVTTVGSMKANDRNEGELVYDGEAKRLMLDELERPVHTAFQDLDGDGKLDAVVSGFGNWTGSLSVFHGPLGPQSQKTPLRAEPGAVRTSIGDLTGDGRPDIVALFAHGDEALFLFENQTTMPGEFRFIERRLLEFGPSHGSNGFEMVDVNQDGNVDILMTNGDNADYPMIPKAYHGIRLFLGDSKGAFREAFFFPMHGVVKAIARDFDLDGDLDIAAISFFPDFERRPEESFVYLENRGDLSFAASTMPEAKRARFLVMDGGDIDGDGDPDIVLGAHYQEAGVPKADRARLRQEPLWVLALENETKPRRP
jgi:hypothetical protein